MIAQKNQKQRSKSFKKQLFKRRTCQRNFKGLGSRGNFGRKFGFAESPASFKVLGVAGAKDRYRAKRTIYNLKNKRLVNFYENGVIEITEKGKKKVLQYNIEEMNIKLPTKWDGYWRIVIFDVPEKFKKARKRLERKNKRPRFFPLQKSVFVYPFECRNEIDFVSEFFNVGRFVHYIVAKELDSENF